MVVKTILIVDGKRVFVECCTNILVEKSDPQKVIFIQSCHYSPPNPLHSRNIYTRILFHQEKEFDISGRKAAKFRIS